MEGLCIYELMAEESAVNYWEKYGNIAFDSTQKAVLTSCVLRFKPKLEQNKNRMSASCKVVSELGGRFAQVPSTSSSRFADSV